MKRNVLEVVHRNRILRFTTSGNPVKVLQHGREIQSVLNTNDREIIWKQYNVN